MTLKYPLYLKSADPAAVAACIRVIQPLYTAYSPTDIAEAHHQIRRELDLIKDTELKQRRITALTAELENSEHTDTE